MTQYTSKLAKSVPAIDDMLLHMSRAISSAEYLIAASVCITEQIQQLEAVILHSLLSYMCSLSHLTTLQDAALALHDAADGGGLEDDRPAARLHDGYLCAIEACPQRVAHNSGKNENGQFPITGIRYECTVCLGLELPKHGQPVGQRKIAKASKKRAKASKKGIVPIVPHLSFCAICFEGHDQNHPMLMYRISPEPIAVSSKAKLPTWPLLEVITHRTTNHVLEFQVNWEGAYVHSWHTEEELKNPEIIPAYWARLEAVKAKLQLKARKKTDPRKRQRCNSS